MCGGDGHTEALRIEYDPDVVTYDQLLDQFYNGLSTGGSAAQQYGIKPRLGAQYMSAVWYHTESQKKALEARIDKGSPLVPIAPAKPWHDAEKRHQKFHEGGSPRLGLSTAPTTAAVLEVGLDDDAKEAILGPPVEADEWVKVLRMREAVPGIRDWLRGMGISKHLAKVNEWCDEMGAVALSEVVDEREELADHLGDLLSEKERQKLLN